MIVSLMVNLIETSLAASAAILVVMALRGHVQRRLGPGAAYLMWAIVPIVTLAMLVPARTINVTLPVASLSGLPWSETISPLAGMILFSVWASGAGVMAAWTAVRQLAFLRDVKRGVAGPAAMGFLETRIVTPKDFAERFSVLEQRLILAHEDVHLERQDTRINALAALARCVMWFNPLAHIGERLMRADQEASCDATVLERRPKSRRVYAETLLKSQLESRSLPVGCYWPAEDVHPLTERIAMLTRAPISQRRRLAATCAVLLLAGGGGVAAWAAQPAHQVLIDAAEADLVWVRPLPAVVEFLVTILPATEPEAPPGR